MNAKFWKNRKVFITGHTGFKGSWTCVLLDYLGADIKGYGLNPNTTPSLFNEANVESFVDSDIGDIRDIDHLKDSIKSFQPEIVIHMAAQPLVRESYHDPLGTYQTNVIGTVNLFESIRTIECIKAVVNVTTDKCYENKEWAWGYRENEPMGGHDPYSNSKACSELITASYRLSFFNQKEDAAIASARAGNVIGGGDWAEDRLIPDMLKSFEKGEQVAIRNPESTRPWQHVLEPISGYLLLSESLYSCGHEFAEGWNFGPFDEDVKSVKIVADNLVQEWGHNVKWIQDGEVHPHEATLLKLDISKALSRLNWSPKLRLNTAIANTVKWHQGWLEGKPAKDLCINEIEQFFNQ